MNENIPKQNDSIAPDKNEFIDALQVVVDNFRLLFFGPILAGVLALGGSFIVTPTFTATTTFLPPPQQQSVATAMLQSLGGVGAGVATALKNPLDQYVTLAGSRTVEDALVERFELVKRYDVKFKQDARKVLESSTRIVSAKEGLIRVEFEDHDPEFAAAVANGYVEELTALLGRIAITEAQQRRTFFEAQLVKAKDGLAKAELALRATGIGESEIKASPSAAIGTVANLMAQITAKEVQLGSMRNYLSENAPDIKRTQSEIAALRVQVSRAEKDNSGGGGNANYVAKYRDFKYHETLFDLMARQYELARADESKEGWGVQVVDIAIPPERKSKPKKLQIAVLTAIATGFFLLIFVFLRNAIFNHVSSARGNEKILRLKEGFIRAISFGRS